MAGKKNISKTAVRDELIKQLTLKRANIDPFVSLIDDYIAMWGIKTDLIRDIRRNGSVLKTEAGARLRNNPSVKELVGVNKQMLTLLRELGLSTSNVGGDEDDDQL